MIRNETEYQAASARAAEEENRLAEHRVRLEQAGLGAGEIKRVMRPVESFHRQLKAELKSYERWKRGEFDPLENLRGLGPLLVALRIAQGMSQRELAERLELQPSQVSRYEGNEYVGITLERAAQILDALGARLHTTVELRPRSAPASS